MICYRDKTFCDAPCAAHDCQRMLTDDVQSAATVWWRGPDAPIATADLREGCTRYLAPEARASRPAKETT